MVSLEVKNAWNERYAHARHERLHARVLLAFNANVDYVKFVNFTKINTFTATLSAEQAARVLAESEKEILERANDELDILAALVHAIRFGKALHVVGSTQAFEWLETFFGEPDRKEIGGQTGIMANSLVALGANAIAWPVLFSPRQAFLFDERVQVPVVKNGKLVFLPPKKAARPGDELKVNWILEFKQGDAMRVGGKEFVCPRANRLIITSEKREQPFFSKELEPFLPKIGASVDVAILAGFHYLKPDHKEFNEALKRVCSQLRALKKKNKNLLLHWEYVPIEHKELEKKVLVEVSKNVDGIGLNETELSEVLHMLGCTREAHRVARRESAYTIYLGLRKLFEKLGLKRLQVHSLGYTTVLLKKPYSVSPNKVRDACVFASLVSSLKARTGLQVVKLEDLKHASEVSVSDTGLNQVSIFDSEIADELLKTMRVKFSSAARRKFFAEGIIEMKNHFVLIVPAPIIPAPKQTVGLGDVFSSTFLAKEKS